MRRALRLSIRQLNNTRINIKKLLNLRNTTGFTHYTVGLKSPRKRITLTSIRNFSNFDGMLIATAKRDCNNIMTNNRAPALKVGRIKNAMKQCFMISFGINKNN